MKDTYQIAVATTEDIPGILDLQEHNQLDRGGMLSVRLSREWLEAVMAAMPVMVARRDGRIVGFLVSSTITAMGHVPVIQKTLAVHPAVAGAYLYGPICVAESERGRGIAVRLFDALRRRLPGREGVLFIRGDNVASLRAHERMGMRKTGEFMHDNLVHVVLAYTG